MPELPIKNLPPILTDTAGNGVEFALDGHTLQLVHMSDPDIVVYVSPTQNTNNRTRLHSPGDGWEHFSFDRIWVWWDAKAGGSFELAAGGNPNDADPSKQKRLIGQSLASAVTIAGTPTVVTTGTVKTEPVTIDMSEQAAAFWLDASKTTTSVDGEQVIEMATGRSLDINSAVITGDDAVVEVRDNTDASRWKEAGGVNGNTVKNWTIPAGHKLFLRTTNAANTAKITYTGKLTIVGGTTPYDTITIDSSKVGAGGHTSHLVWFPKSIMSDQARAIIRPDGGDVRVYSADGLTEYPRATVKQWGVAIGWLGLIPNVSDSTDKTVRLEYDGTRSEPAAASTYGRHAAMVDYDLWLPMLDDPAGGTMYDLSPNDLHATVSGDCTTSADGLVFGGNGSVSVPNTGGILDSGAGDLSIGVDIKTTLTGDVYETLVSNCKDGADLECASVLYGNDESPWWGVTNSVGAGAYQYRTALLNDGNLHRLLNTYDNTTGAAWAYIDGAAGSASHDADLAGVDWSTGNAIRIGGGINFTGPTPLNDFVGTIRHVTWRRSVVTTAQRDTEHANWNDPATFFKTITAH